MPQMIAAMFETRAKAEQALEALLGSGLSADRIAVIGRDAEREVSSISGFRDLERDPDLTALHKLSLPEEDRRTFEEGLRRGCALVAARIDRDRMEEAVRVLDMFEPIDLDRRSEALQAGGSDPALPRGGDLGAPLGAGLTAGNMAGQTNTSAVPGMGTMTVGHHDVGATDRRTDETSLPGTGRSSSSTRPTGERAGEGRSERPGVLEMAPGYRRETNLTGRVRAYTRD